jgi:glucose-6-phosphate dehydrogenase assembly protein OpcA
VVLRPGENVCEILVEENETRVEVLILICGEIEGGNDAMDCPFHVHLSSALGDREVIDMARNGAKVEHFTPNW